MTKARYHLVALSSVAIVLAGAAAPASARTNAEQRQAAARVQTGEQVHCIRGARTGTRIVRTACRTQREWERFGVELLPAR